MEEKKTLGKYIADKRRERCMAQKELADMLFVSESAVSKWERGKSYPDITMITSLCQALKVTEHELITASDDDGQREIVRQAGKYRRMKTAWKVATYAAYTVALIPAFIVMVIKGHDFAEFCILLTSLLMVWSFINLPGLLGDREHKGLYILGSFYISLQLLLLSGCIYSGGSWYLMGFLGTTLAVAVIFGPLVLKSIDLPEALSDKKLELCLGADSVLILLMVLVGAGRYAGAGMLVTLYCLAFAWALAMVIKYAGCSGFFKTAVCLIIMGVWQFFASPFGDIVMGDYRGMPQIDLGDWNMATYNGNITLIVLLSCLAAALIFCIAGAVKHMRR